MKILESYGIVTENGKQWKDLCDLIVDYMFDVKDGLNADPFYDEDNQEISLKNLISYYKYKYSSTIKQYLIPDWVGDFTVYIVNDKEYKGQFNKPNAELKDGKLVFDINLTDKQCAEPNQFHETLMHEFRHAYTTYLEKSKNFKLYNKRSVDLYKEAGKVHTDEKFDKTLNLIDTCGMDYLTIKEDIFTNPVKSEQAILNSFYYTDKDEINSFLQEFADRMQYVIDKNKDQLVKELKTIYDLKKKYPHLSKADQLRSNVLDNIGVTCYHNQYFTIYKSYQEFWKNISKINESDAEVIVNDIKRAIKIYLKKPISAKLIHFDGDATNILKTVANKQLKIYDKVIWKMERIYMELIMNINSVEEQNEVIADELDADFEKELINLIQ